MNEHLAPLGTEKSRKSKFREVLDVIRLGLIPALATQVKIPTKEQGQQVERALNQSLGIWTVAFIELLRQSFKLEISKVDTRKEHEKKDDDVSFVNITGVWGLSWQTVAEIQTLAVAMGEKGLLLDAVSLPGHGHSDDIPGGWGSEGDFDFAASAVAAHIAENVKDHRERPVVINAWSMGGVTALKVAAQRPDLVDGLILVDTPVFPQSFRKLVIRFFSYELQKLRTVRAEKKFEMQVKDPGLGIFISRIKDRNEEHGIPLSVVFNSGRSLAKADLVKDKTLDQIAENAKTKNIPILILRGSNDYLIPHEQTTRLSDELKKRGVDVIIKTVQAAGHSLIVEQPVASGEIIREWLEEKKLI